MESDVVRRGFGVVCLDDGAGGVDEGDGGVLGCHKGVEGGGFPEKGVDGVEDWIRGEWKGLACVEVVWKRGVRETYSGLVGR